MTMRAQAVLDWCARISRPVSLSRSRGVALPVVMLITSMMMTTSSAWFEASLTASHNAASSADQLQALHAADAALTLCASVIVAGDIASGADHTPLAYGEPVGWKSSVTFEGGALTPVAQWPGSIKPPQCLVEPWRLRLRPETRAFLVTARGYGHTVDTQAWLQLQLAIADGSIERHWRHVAARPY